MPAWIPAFEAVLQLAHTSILLFCHSGLDPESSAILRFFRFWMPDQVRHDGQNSITFLNYDTASFAGMTTLMYLVAVVIAR